MADAKSDCGFGGASGDAMRAYEQTLVAAMFEPWAHLLLDELGASPGEAVLDVATGPGTLARVAATRVGPGGRITGCDLSSAMLAIARDKPPRRDAAPIEYLECPADALSVPSEGFDVVACQQGLQFFPDRPAALAEMHRTAKAAGRLGVAVWADICLLYTSPSPRDLSTSRMPSSA